MYVYRSLSLSLCLSNRLISWVHAGTHSTLGLRVTKKKKFCDKRRVTKVYEPSNAPVLGGPLGQVMGLAVAAGYGPHPCRGEWRGSEAGSYSRLIDFVYHSTPGLRETKKN